MGKINTKRTAPSSTLPAAPWIYINDPDPQAVHAYDLSSLISDSSVVLYDAASVNHLPSWLCINRERKLVSIVSTLEAGELHKDPIQLAKNYQKCAIRYACGAASVHLYHDQGSTPAQIEAWGTNHLELCIQGLERMEIAEKIYKWLFTIFTVPETLYLIPDAQMREVNTKYFPDFEYCTLAEARTKPKDARIQFVTVIISKPQVQEGKKLTWTVADKTAKATFYFQYRDESSLQTWNWVLSLQPGDRKALPRMPSVCITEPRRTRALKFPLRAIGGILSGTGYAIHSLGRGFAGIGHKIENKLGKAKEWVPEEDVVVGEDGSVKKKIGDGNVIGKIESPKPKAAVEKKEIKIFDEKGSRLWKDDGSVTSSEKDKDWDMLSATDSETKGEDVVVCEKEIL